MRWISSLVMGSWKTLWLVCGSQMLMPLRSIAICSDVPPLRLMSACAPSGPRWRTSAPATYLMMSLMLCAGMVAMSVSSSIVTILGALSGLMGALEAVMTISSSLSSLSVFVVVWAVAAVLAVMSVAAPSTPILTSRPSAANSE